MSFDPKAPGEIVPLTFDFSQLSAKLATAVVTCSYDSGLADSAPETVLLGLPALIGSHVIQRAQGGQHGTAYRFTCDVDDVLGNRYTLISTMYVRHARPE